MRRTVALTLVAALLLPTVSFAQTSKGRARATSSRSKVKASPKPAAPAPAPEPPPAPAATPSDAPRKEETVTSGTPVPSAAKKDALNLADRKLLEPSNKHRYAYVVGAFVGVTAFAFGYWAQGEARRAETIQSADDASRVLDRAKTTAATANLLYGLAAATVAYGLVMEFLPKETAEKASMTFHF